MRHDCASDLLLSYTMEACRAQHGIHVYLSHESPALHRLAALHALAVVAGAQRVADAKASSAALMSPQAEDALRLAVYGGVGTRTPAEAMLALLHQPLLDLRHVLRQSYAVLDTAC